MVLFMVHHAIRRHHTNFLSKGSGVRYPMKPQGMTILVLIISNESKEPSDARDLAGGATT
jgi:hypothetical protein